MNRPRMIALGLTLAAGGVMLVLNMALAQQVHRNGFETRTLGWFKGAADAPFQELVHELTDKTAHTGQFSEHIQLNAEPGSYIHYHYPTGRAPITEELSCSVWLKANRPSIQLQARLVLPRERNPHNLEEPLTTLLRGEMYQLVGRWQRVELRRPTKLAQEQQQLMRAELGRDVNFTDAYIDRIILNIYGGPGLHDVFIDDLEIGPVLDQQSPFQPASRPKDADAHEPITNLRDSQQRVAPPFRPVIVELNQDRLLVGGKRFFFRGIRHSDTPLKALRDAGFNTVWMDIHTPPHLQEEAINLGFWLVPALPVAGPSAQALALDRLSDPMSRFIDSGAVLFWDLGGGLVSEQKEAIRQATRALHVADTNRPLAGDVWDGVKSYSLLPDFMVGVHRWPLMTGLEMTGFRDWIEQRRQLARPGSFLWTWVQTHLPEWYTQLVYGRVDGKGFSDPIGPQPEQIRLLSYIAVASGCRGLGFWSDRYLADSHQGRDRLLTMALLNQELHMLEPLLVSVQEQPAWIDTSVKDIKAAVLRTEHGVLVLPIWMGRGAQFVPGQSAVAHLSITVPQVPAGAQAWEITPGDVRSLRIERVMGGTRVTLPEFGLTAAILFTSDNGPDGLLVRFQDQARRMRKLAAQWAHDLAAAEMDKVLKIEAELERRGHTLPDGQALQDNARARLRESVARWNSGDYRAAYWEAHRALRPLRILMRAQWDLAMRGLDTPVASPYALSFFTLPKHWEFMEEIQRATPGANVLPDGDFEVSPDRAPASWSAQEITMDNVELEARRVSDKPREGKQCLMLRIRPAAVPSRTNQSPVTPAALERTYLAIHSPAVRLQPGTLVRISGWMRIPEDIQASADGALFYDSAGGEPLAVRLTETTRWKKFTLYRRVPASGTIHLTLALTGVGTVYFDDLRIEPLFSNTTPPAATGITTSHGPPSR
ncbi:MAG: hypothetical protein ACK4RK_13725 [Gemmataceae bacterium]